MYEFMKKNGQMVALGLGVLITAIFLIMIFSGDTSLNAETPDAVKYNSSEFSFGIFAAIALAVLCAIAALLFGIVQTASNPKGSLRGLVGLGLVIALILVGYAMATGTPVDDGAALVDSVQRFEESQSQEISNTTYKFIGGSIRGTVYLLIISVLALLGFGVASFFK